MKLSLKPHPASPAPKGIDLEFLAEESAEGFRLVFSLRAAPDLLARIPRADPAPIRRDELWRATCFEAFFGIAGTPAYFEANFAPTGDWAWYAFDDYRAGMTAPPLAAGDEPRVVGTHREGDRLVLECHVPRAAFRKFPVDSISPTAVLAFGDASYWAANHAGAKADFHLRESFVAISGTHPARTPGEIR